MGKVIDLVVGNLVAVVQTRRSRRWFDSAELSQREREMIREFAKSSLEEVPFLHDIQIRLDKRPAGMSVCPFRDPPDFAAFISPPGLMNQAKVGFIGELLILYAESLHINSCWIGHYRRQNLEKIIGPIGHESVIYAITPLGHAPERATGLSERMSSRLFARKKPFQAHVTPNTITAIPDPVTTAFSLASQAPSAMNSQPWHLELTLDHDEYRLVCGKKKGYKHFKWAYPDVDAGAMAAHCWLGLVHEGVYPEVEIVDDGDRVLWNMKFQLEGK